MSSPSIQCKVKEYRHKLGISQKELATLVQIQRQAIYDIESGRYLPNTAVALRLAKVLGCTVEDLFIEEPAQAPQGICLINTTASTDENKRLVLARVREKMVGVSLQGHESMPFTLHPADALLRAGEEHIASFQPTELIDQTILVLGCDPALSLLQGHMTRLAPSIRVRTAFASSQQALHILGQGLAHVAGTHFHNSGAEEANVAAIHSALPNMPCSVIAFSLLEEGLMIAKGNPLRITSISDLTNPAVRVVNREQGAALRKLFDTLLVQHSIPSTAITGYDTEVYSHCEGAFHVACKTADAALGLRVIASSFGLDFIPLASTRCDLAIPKDVSEHPGIRALMDMLQSSRLHNELRSLPGYDASCTGQIIMP